MKTTQIAQFVLKYLEAEQCEVIEKHPAYVTVKLSPSADKDLTNRSYYWSFVERTGAPPETMTMTFVFDPESSHGAAALSAGKPGSPAVGGSTATSPAAASPSLPAGSAAQGQPGQQQPDSILGRYFGFVPTSVATRVPKDEVTFGSRRLEQIFGAVKTKGKYVRLFEEPQSGYRMSPAPLAYDTWFHANFKVELASDMKRSEIHSLGIRLTTGEIVEQFYSRIAGKKLTPRLPANVHLIPDKMSVSHAVAVLEKYVETELRQYDHSWADEAHDRLLDELDRVRSYYDSLIKSAEEDKKADFENHYRNRQAEIEWQYRPRILVSVINCGLFHFNATNGTST